MESSIKKVVLFLTFLFIFNYVFSPTTAITEPIIEKSAFLEPKPNKKIMILTITGYSSSYDETDETPWLTAYGTLTRDGVVASNILPFGTKIRIPSLFGNKVFVVEDKMNPRFGENLDIWFPSKESALKFGVHYDVLVEILE